MYGRVAEEVRGLWRQAGVLMHVAILVLFGFFLPWLKGAEFLDPVILGAYACLGVVFAAPAGAAPFEQPPGVERALARVLAAVLYGTLMSILMLAGGVVTVYSTRTVVVGPQLEALRDCALFGLALSAAMAAAGAWISARFSAGAAKASMRVVFLALLIAFFQWSRWLPDVALRGAAVSCVAAAAFLIALGTRRAA